MVTSVPDLPEELVRRVDEAVRDGGVLSELTAGELAAHAELAVELAERFAGRPGDFEAFAAGTDFTFDEWLLNLPLRLADAGLVDEALRVADALRATDKRYEADYAGEAARLLARAGRGDEARERIRACLASFGDIPYTWLTAGEALAALGDVDGATDAYERAIDVAEERDEPGEVADAYGHLDQFLDEHPEASSRVREPTARVRISTGDATQAPVRSEKIPRNKPCPCGSGRKYKRCCGSPR
jgi:tetratricopeptide (TPR) repeat protein